MRNPSQEISAARKRISPRVSRPHLKREATNAYGECTFTTKIGTRRLQVVEKAALEARGGTARAAFVLPATSCDVAPGPRGGYGNCVEYRYQFLDEDSCVVSPPLIAKDAL